jgi:hypothetical protein
VLRHALPGKDRGSIRNRLIARLDDGLLFDAFEWYEFVEKKMESNRDARPGPKTLENEHA